MQINGKCRHLRKEIQTTVIPCKFSFIQGDLNLEAGKFEFTGDPHAVLTEHKNFISLSKQVPVSISRHQGSRGTQNFDINTGQSATSLSDYSSYPVSNDSFDMPRSSSTYSNRSLFNLKHEKSGTIAS